MSRQFQTFQRDNKEQQKDRSNIMKECYVFEEDGRFTGQVIDMTLDPEIRETPKIRRVTPISLVLRYNILLEAFTKTKRDW